MVTSTSVPLEDRTTTIQASNFTINSVKLFCSDTAEVTRTFSLAFLRSQDEPQAVEIIHLPANLQSVDVSVISTSGNVTILDHYHATHPSSSPSSQALQELQAQRQRLEDERRLRQQNFTFLTTYMDSLAQGKSRDQPEAAQMISFFDDFVEIGITRSAVITELDGKLVDVDSKIAEETQRLSKLNSELPVKVVTVLACDSKVPVEAAELVVTYVVKQVSWKPAYDLRITMTGNTPSPTARLDFRCSVTQWTGESWENASLALTTAGQVPQLIQLPEPKKVDISVSPRHKPTAPPEAPAWSPFQPPPAGSAPLPPPRFHFPSLGTKHPARVTTYGWLQVGHKELEQARERYGLHDQPARPVLEEISTVPPVNHKTQDDTSEAKAPSQIVSQPISDGNKDPIIHIASSSIFIPTDHIEHHVLIASLSLQADFMHVAVPSIDTRVYCVCEVVNTSGYALLPGTVKVYLNDKHVSSTEIHNTELPQVLECPLAMDTGVKAIYNVPDAPPLVVGAFTGRATTTHTRSTVMIIHNTHVEPIRGLIVRSAIPYSSDSRTTIVLKEPRGLAEIDEGSVYVKEGCLARWSTTGGRKGKQAGLFEWVCDVNPGTETLKAVWEVCEPVRVG